MEKFNDGKCFVCGEITQSLSANPSAWGFFMPHIDGQGKHRYYHTKCLYKILTRVPVDIEKLLNKTFERKDVWYKGELDFVLFKAAIAKARKAIKEEVNNET